MHRLERYVRADSFIFRSIDTEMDGKECLLQLWDILLLYLNSVPIQRQHIHVNKIYQFIQ